MTQQDTIKIFQEKQVRTIWDEDKEDWYLSIIDVILILTQSNRPRKYWNDLKIKLKKEGSELSENIGQLKMKAPDGKMRLTDVASTKQLFRLIQTIPSPKAEPFKLWLATLAKDISQATNPQNLDENKIVAKQGGNVARIAKEELETKTGNKVVTNLNAKSILENKNDVKS